MKEINDTTFRGYPLVHKLALAYNEMEVVQDNSFDYLEKLKFLYLQGNKLKRFHQIFPGSELNTLTLDFNPIIELNISTSSNLILELREVNLTRVKNFGSVPNLEKLFIDRNSLEDLQIVDIAQYPNLKYISLLESTLGIFSECKGLKNYLSENNIVIDLSYPLSCVKCEEDKNCTYTDSFNTDSTNITKEKIET